MDTIKSIHQWSITHHPRWLIFPRLVLGALLSIKGITFISNATLLENLLSGRTRGGSEHLTDQTRSQVDLFF